MDLLSALNDPDRSMDYPLIDKSQVYRWLKGQLPHGDMQFRIAAALSLEDPRDLFRDPNEDWFAKFFAHRSEEELKRIRLMLEAAFPMKKSG